MLILGDCLEEMAKLPPASVDLILCDLPYGTTQNKWDSIINLTALWAQYWRVAKLNTPVVLTAAQPFTSVLVCSSIKQFKYDWTWKKPEGTGHLNAKKQPMRDKEDILVFYREQPIYNPQFSTGAPYKNKAGKDHASRSSMTGSYGHYTNFREDNPGRRYPKQVLEFGVVERGTIHPTEKPVALMEYMIRTYSNEGAVVMDNCFGSCATGIACLNTGRKFIGIERDPDYFRLGSDRFHNHVPSNELFA